MSEAPGTEDPRPADDDRDDEQPPPAAQGGSFIYGSPAAAVDREQVDDAKGADDA